VIALFVDFHQSLYVAPQKAEFTHRSLALSMVSIHPLDLAAVVDIIFAIVTLSFKNKHHPLPNCEDHRCHSLHIWICI